MKKVKSGLVITTAALVCTAAFGACAGWDLMKKETPKSANGITATTKFEDIKSETVADEDAWKAVFAKEKYTNYTFKFVGEKTKTNGTNTETRKEMWFGQLTETAVFYSVEEGANGSTYKEDKYLLNKNETIAGGYIEYKNGEETDRSFAEISAEEALDDKEVEDLLSGEEFHEYIDASAKYNFSDVTYDTSKNGYVLTESKQAEENYDFTIKISGGMLAGFEMEGTYGEGENATRETGRLMIYDVGITKIDLPLEMTNNKENEKEGDKSDDNVHTSEGGEVHESGEEAPAYDSIISDKAETDEAWAAMFDYSNYTNFSVETIVTRNGETDGQSLCIYDDNIIYGPDFEVEGGEVIYVKDYIYTYDPSTKTWAKNYDKWRRFDSCRNWAVTKFENRSDFTYSNEKKAYYAASTNIIFDEYYSETWTDVEIKFKDGKLAAVKYTVDGDVFEEVYFGYGKAIVEPPVKDVEDFTGGEVHESGEEIPAYDSIVSDKVDTEEMWNAMFDTSAYTNFSAIFRGWSGSQSFSILYIFDAEKAYLQAENADFDCLFEVKEGEKYYRYGFSSDRWIKNNVNTLIGEKRRVIINYGDMSAYTFSEELQAYYAASVDVTIYKEMTVTDVELKFKDGKLAAARFKSDDEYYEVIYWGYGKATVEPPFRNIDDNTKKN